MKKTLYSLMLNDDVVREIDRTAHRMGTNRSQLINRILADYVGFATPESRMEEIFRVLEELVSPSRELVSYFAPNTNSFSLKSSLDYKYRPTVKYEIVLSRDEDRIGELNVIFRTQSDALIRSLTGFLRFWKSLEDHYLPRLDGSAREYALYDGKFVRSLARPEREFTSEELAEALSDYVQLFDRAMKDYVVGAKTESELEDDYRAALEKAALYL